MRPARVGELAAGYVLTVRKGRTLVRRAFVCAECSGDAPSTCDCVFDALVAFRESGEARASISRRGVLLAHNGSARVPRDAEAA